MISFLALAQSRTHTHTWCYVIMLWYLLLHLHTDGMLRYDFFSCTCTILHTYTHTLDATLWYLLFHLHNLVHKHTHTRDARLWYLLLHLHNLAHTLDATLWFLALHLHNLARTHTHTHTHIWCYDMISSFGQNLPMDFQAQFGKAATDQQHEKRMENVQIKQFIVKWSKHIIYEMAKSEAFSYVFVHWSQKRRGEPCYHVFGVPTSLPFATPGSRKCFIR